MVAKNGTLLPSFTHRPIAILHLFATASITLCATVPSVQYSSDIK